MKNIDPFKLERFYSKHEFSSEYLLCASDCEASAIADLLILNVESASEFCNLPLGYTPTSGSPYLREAISDLYKKIIPEDILVHCGAQEAIFLFFNSFLSAGDHVIVQAPCYQSFLSVPKNIGCQVSKWPMKFDGKWSVDLDNLESLIAPNTKLICINSPNNPTGYHFSKTEFSQIIAIARKYGVAIFSDEVYQHLEYSKDDFLPAIADEYENGISLNVMSKSFGLAGLRIGWIATTMDDVLKKVSILKEYTSICNSSPSEFLASLALKSKEIILAKNIQLIQSNLVLAEAFFLEWKHMFNWDKPKAGPISFVKMAFENDSELFIHKLLAAKKILLLPGEVYDCPGFFRMGFGRRNFPEALSGFSAFLNTAYCANKIRG